MSGIYFFSDFGVNDSSVGEVKAVIERVGYSKVFDMSHEIGAEDNCPDSILHGAYFLDSRLRNIPCADAVLAVVDPGVGTNRKAIAINSDVGFLVGPDNGLLMSAAKKYNGTEVRELSNPDFWNPSYMSVNDEKTSAIFHGRDIFGPAAAFLAHSANFFKDIGDKLDIDTLVKSPYQTAQVEGNTVVGAMVPYIDLWGNTFTNVELTDLVREGKLPSFVEVNGYVLPMVQSFGHVDEGKSAVMDDCYGNLHLGVNMGSFSETYGVSQGNSLDIVLHYD